MNIYKEIETERINNIKPVGLDYLLLDYVQKKVKLLSKKLNPARRPAYTGKRIPFDIVDKVVECYKKGMISPEICELYCVSSSTVNKIRRNAIRSGELEMAGIRERISSKKKARIVRLLKQGKTYLYIQDEVKVSAGTVGNVKREWLKQRFLKHDL